MTRGGGKEITRVSRREVELTRWTIVNGIRVDASGVDQCNTATISWTGTTVSGGTSPRCPLWFNCPFDGKNAS
jgi:hypothetical protein